MLGAVFKKPLTHIILIAAVGLLAYSNTFNVPFQWDEGMTIVNNPIVKDLRYFLHPSEAKGFTGYHSFRDRYIGYLSFALNYKLQGLDVRGYHVVNIALHILNALLVYALVRLTLKAPVLTPRTNGGVFAQYIPTFVALIFVSHPIQTEAVTYVMGRLPLLMWFFYLSSMVLYAKWRLDSAAERVVIPAKAGIQRLYQSGQERHWIPGQARNDKKTFLYLLSLLSAVLAMKTKENALTLPFSIALYEFMFFDGTKEIASVRNAPRNDVIASEAKQSRSLRNRLLYLAPFALTLLIVPLSLLSFDKPVVEVIGGIESASRHYTETPRMSYLFTQFRVLVTYVRLLFLPINQNFDYDYPVYNSFFNPQVLISFLLLLSIFSLGVFFLIRSNRGNPALRLLAWGVFWFFITLSVESSIFPIPMIISEYRLYAPSMGIILAVVSALVFFVKGQRSMAFLAAIVIVLSGAAHARNAVWESRVGLWEDVVRKSPKKERGHFNLSKRLLDIGDIDKAIRHLQITISLKPDYAEAHSNLGSAYKMKGLMERAKEQYLSALSLEPDFAEAHYNLGQIYGNTGKSDKAIEHFKKAISLMPDNAKAYYNLGVNYGAKGMTDEAISCYLSAIRLNPAYIEAYINLGVAYREKGLIDKAIEQYLTGLKLKPTLAEAHYNLGNAYIDKGLTDLAITAYLNAISLRPDYEPAHFYLGLSYLDKGFYNEAKEEFEAVLRLNPKHKKAKKYLNQAGT